MAEPKPYWMTAELSEEYIPKGSMCMVCRHRERWCNHLPFKDYKVLERFDDGEQMLIVVRCKEWERDG